MQRLLHQNNYDYKNVRKQIILTENQKVRTKEFYTKLLRDRIDFAKVVFTDEKKINLDRPDHWLLFHLKRENQPSRQKRQQGGVGVMAHCTVLSNGSIHLFFCDNKIDCNEYKRIIESEILPFIESHQKMTLFITMTQRSSAFI